MNSNQKIENIEHRNLQKGEFWQVIPAYQNVTMTQFMDHHWQLKNSITNVKKLLETLKDIVSPEFYRDAELGFRSSPMAVRVTPYALSLIDWKNPEADPLRRQFVPLASQLESDHPELHLDSLHEQEDSPVDGLTHRYPDKVLFLALDICPVYCRYCTRSYAVGTDTESVEKVRLSQDLERYQKMFAYIEAHPQIEDVVLSGGDAYMIKAERLRYLLESLLAIPHVQRIRIATKGLAILPMKILTDHEWYGVVTEMVQRARLMHKEVCVHTHFSHPKEITEITQQALHRMTEDGIFVRNQAVLQRGVNDDPQTMLLLNRRLGYINVHPYYVYIHDLVQGVEDLRTSVQTAINIDKYVRGATAGFNTPTFVVDAPGGGGKRPATSYESYNRETGISVYIAPVVKPNQYFMYFDPMSALSPQIQKDWQDSQKREQMKQDALNDAIKNVKELYYDNSR